jgi:hypothetical protein
MKKWQIIILGSIIYWVFAFLLHQLFLNVSESIRFLEILLMASLAPFLLGLIISLLTGKDRGWIYGVASYLLYYAWVFIFVWIFELRLNDFIGHLQAMLKAFLYLGVVSALSAAIGGFISGHITKKRWT